MTPFLLTAARAAYGPPVRVVMRPTFRLASPSPEITVDAWRLSAKASRIPDKPWIHCVWIYLTSVAEIVAAVALVPEKDLEVPSSSDLEFDPERPMEASRCVDLEAAESWILRASGVEVRSRYGQSDNAAFAAVQEADAKLRSLGTRPHHA